MSDARIKRIIRITVLFGLLYLFLFSIRLLGDSLKIFGQDLAEALISSTAHPIVGLLVGILATSIVQSSSMTTSLIVGLVGGGLLTVENAIPMVMGANIGTTITNILVSLVHINRENEFRRAFAAATVHDMFNLLAVLVFLPLQIATNFLGIVSEALANTFQNIGGLKMFNPLKEITKPVAEAVIDLLDHIIPDNFLFANSHGAVGSVIALIILFLALSFLVKILKRVFVGKVSIWFQQYIFKTIARSFTVGLLITLLVQSSSVTTSLIVPLAGSGVLSVVQIYPYTLGANLGTTGTAILASLATGNVNGVAIAFAHMCFNICGILVFLPLRFIPIGLSRKLADLSVKSRIIPFAFVGTLFFIIPILLITFWR